MSEDLKENIEIIKKYMDGGVYIISFRLETDEKAKEVEKFDPDNNYNKRYKSLTDQIESMFHYRWSETTSFWCVSSDEKLETLKNELAKFIEPEIDHLLIVKSKYSQYALIGEPKQKNIFEYIFEELTSV